MKQIYAICDCNSKVEVFKKQFLTFLGYLYVIFIILEVFLPISAGVIIQSDSVPNIKSQVNKAFYRTCFKDPQFTAEFHRISHEKCIKLGDAIVWANTIPKDIISYNPVTNEFYDNLKAYLDSQQKKFNLTECFTKLQKNYLSRAESGESILLIFLNLAIINTILFATVTTIRCSKLENGDEVSSEIFCCIACIFVGCIFGGLTFYELRNTINVLKAYSMDYFVAMC